MFDAPEKIWIEHDDCPYFYEESELTEVGSPVTEYTRSDLVAELEAENEWLKHALEAANKRAEAEAAREAMREDRDSQQRVCIAVMTERDALRARVAELEGALTEISKQTYGTEIWMDGDERAEILGRHLVRLRSLAFTALKGASHEQ